MMIVLLTGEVHSGKSNALLQLMDKKQIFGLINPVDQQGKKYFLPASTPSAFPMESDDPAEFGISVGKYRFSAGAFERANRELIDEWKGASGVFVFDEVGKLELREEGLFHAIQFILSNPNPKVKTLIFVVRDYLLESASEKFGWQNATVIYKEDVPLFA